MSYGEHAVIWAIISMIVEQIQVEMQCYERLSKGEQQKQRNDHQICSRSVLAMLIGFVSA